MQQFRSKHLTGLVVFVPMWHGDSEAAAARRSARAPDCRMVHWWDESRRSDQVFSATLGLHGPAWDIYLLYRVGAMWEGESPPAPDIWMHQLRTELATNPEGYLDPVRLGSAIQQLLGAAESSKGTNADDINAHLS